MKSRIEDVKSKLQELQDGSDDANHTTPAILQHIADFLDNELDGLIRELDDIAIDVEELEEQVEELKEKIEELENAE